MRKTLSAEILSTAYYATTSIYGTNKDAQFNDKDAFLNYISHEGYMTVTSVKVWHGDVIDGVEFVYNHENNIPKGGSAFFHGGKYGNPAEFQLKAGDFIQKIEGEYGRYPFSLEPRQRVKDVIIRLRFTTMSGYQSPWYGNACGKGDKLKGQPFTIDVGKQSVIVALAGAKWNAQNLVYNDYIQAIGAVYMSSLDAKKAYEAYVANK